MKSKVKQTLKKVLNALVGNKYGTLVFFKLMRNFVGEETSRPDVVRIESTNFCNGRCVFCPHEKQTRGLGKMSFKLFEKIVGECKRLGVKEVHLQNFGEPLFDENLFKKIGYAKKVGIEKTVIFSNASLFNEDKITSMINSGLDELYISFEGYSKKIFEQLRPGLKFSVVSSNIKKIREIREKLGKINPRVIINVVSMEEHKRLAKKFLEDWADFADEIILQKHHEWAACGGQEKKPALCNAFWSYATITWDGKVVFCCLDWNAKHVVGDVNKSTLKDIWNNEEYRRLRRKVLAGGIRDIPLCKNCDLLDSEDNNAAFLRFALPP